MFIELLKVPDDWVRKPWGHDGSGLIVEPWEANTGWFVYERHTELRLPAGPLSPFDALINSSPAIGLNCLATPLLKGW